MITEKITIIYVTNSLYFLITSTLILASLHWGIKSPKSHFLTRHHLSSRDLNCDLFSIAINLLLKIKFK